MFYEGIAVLKDLLTEHATVDLGYARSTTSGHQWFRSVQVPILEADVIDVSTVPIGTYQRFVDWLLLEPLDTGTFGADTAYPMRGDLMWWYQSATKIHKYQVGGLGDQPPWEHFDPAQDMLRVHALYLGVDASPPGWTATPPV